MEAHLKDCFATRLGSQAARVRLLVLTVVLLAAARGASAHARSEVAVPVRDGRALAVDVYLPATTGRWPAVLIQTPYDRRRFVPILIAAPTDALLGNPDYAFVVADWRGFYGSAGASAPGYDRGLDGYDLVEWAAAQPWCTSDVGTWGGSALAVIQFRTASKRPPHLRAAVPQVGHMAESYGGYYPGGVWQRNKNTFVSGHFGLVGVEDHPLEDGFWALVDAAAIQPESIDVPMLHISGWYDHETAISLAGAEAIRAGGGPNARDRQWVLVGPWTHGGIGELQQGQVTYPAAAGEAARQAAAFFDHYLRGIAIGWVERPPFRTVSINDDAWRDAETWPPPAARTRRLYLAPNAALADAPAPGATPLAYLSDPTNPVPTLFGAILTEGWGTKGPGDLRSVEARSDVLTFTTPPLARPLHLEGTPVAGIHIECSAVDTDVAVRLTQVYPDGRSLLLVDGIRRASLRVSFSTRQLLAPATAVLVPVELPPVAVTIPAGHRLRVLVASSNYDRFDVNMQDGSSLSDAPGAHPVTAEIRVLLDPASPSWIDIPVVNGSQPRRHLQRSDR
ncbi:MAG: CocE/NonD family hydrolase [Thermoanaerobaculaceae bacterium]|jgi:hypothetical protein|nr:CocE/NonD family hydrolase [Thermoanaerobaculaceae bacterium]